MAHLSIISCVDFPEFTIMFVGICQSFLGLQHFLPGTPAASGCSAGHAALVACKGTAAAAAGATCSGTAGDGVAGEGTGRDAAWICWTLIHFWIVFGYLDKFVFVNSWFVFFETYRDVNMEAYFFLTFGYLTSQHNWNHLNNKPTFGNPENMGLFSRWFWLSQWEIQINTLEMRNPHCKGICLNFLWGGLKQIKEKDANMFSGCQ